LSSLMWTQILLLCLMMVGLICAKAGLIDEKARTSISDLILCVFLPCTTLSAFLDAGFSKLSSLGIIFLISAFNMVICFLLSRYVFYRKAGTEQKKVLTYATVIPNASFLGNPIIESIYGLDALVYSAVYLAPLRVSLWSVGVAIFSGKRASLKKIAFHPCLVATYLGILLMVTNFRPPPLVFRLAGSLGSCTTPLSMMVVGSILGTVKPKHFFSGLTLYFALIRLIIIPLMVIGFMMILRPEPIVLGVSVILSATPAPVTGTILANKYGSDRELASEIVFTSTLFSIVTIPFILWLLTFL
jgi:malate permease and related proteins